MDNVAGGLTQQNSRPPQSPLADWVSTATPLRMLLVLLFSLFHTVCSCRCGIESRPFREARGAVMICAHRP